MTPNGNRLYWNKPLCLVVESNSLNRQSWKPSYSRCLPTPNQASHTLFHRSMLRRVFRNNFEAIHMNFARYLRSHRVRCKLTTPLYSRQTTQQLGSQLIIRSLSCLRGHPHTQFDCARVHNSGDTSKGERVNSLNRWQARLLGYVANTSKAESVISNSDF